MGSQPRPFAFDDLKTGTTFVFKPDPPELLSTPPVRLKPQTLKVLRFFIENPGEVWSREQIVQEVWGLQSEVTNQNVDTHVGLLRQNIGPWCVDTVTKSGYRFTANVRPASDRDLQVTRRHAPAIHALVGQGADPSSPPYVGPQPFTPENAHLFFGRESDCNELMSKLLGNDEQRVVLVFSPSGAGKTSLLNTDLSAKLAKRRFQVLSVPRIVVPLEDVPASMPQGSENLYTFAAIASRPDHPAGDRLAASNWTAYLTSRRSANAEGLVLILDQLEEIVTMRPLGPPNHNREFFLQLRDALRALPSLRVVLAFRQEYLSELERVATDLSPHWNQFRLDRLTRSGAQEAIIYPAEAHGVKIDPDVVGSLVEELARHRYTDGVGHEYDEPGEFVEPLQLQVVCDALWRRLPGHVDRISWREIDQAIPADAHEGARPAGPRGAIKSFVEFVLQGFCGLAIEDVAALEAFPVEAIDLGCQQFISERGTRLIVHQSSDNTGDLPNRIVSRLEERHLLRAVDHNGERLYELAHDTLIEPIRARAAEARRQQLRSRFPKVIATVSISVLAASGAVAVTMVARAFVAYFRLTMTQAPDVGAAAGWFHGVIGALVWGFVIAIYLSKSWLFRGPVRGLKSALVGAGAGLIAGVLISIPLLWAQRSDSLYAALWTSGRASPFWTAYTRTGMGYSMLLFGVGVGSGTGLTAARTLLGRKWSELVKTHSKPRSWNEMRRVLVAVAHRVIVESWSILVPMIIATLALGLVIRSFDYHPDHEQLAFHSAPMWARLVGDCVSITCGGIGLVIGLLFGLFLLRKGIQFPDEEMFSFRQEGESSGRT